MLNIKIFDAFFKDDHEKADSTKSIFIRPYTDSALLVRKKTDFKMLWAYS